jgi:hypothetical protein
MSTDNPTITVSRFERAEKLTVVSVETLASFLQILRHLPLSSRPYAEFVEVTNRSRR